MKKLISLILTACMLVMLLAAAAAPAMAEETEEENYDTGDASLDKPRNDDNIGEKELLVVSFGTSYNESRCIDIGSIEEAMEEAFPDWSVRRAFTSQIVIDHILKRDGEKIDNVTEALDRAANNGVKTLVVQPTHLMHGYEYNDLRNELAEYADAFDKIVLAEPLLNSDADFENVAETIQFVGSYFEDGETAICLMGHGTEAESNSVYSFMQEVFSMSGFDDYFVGTVEAKPSVEDVLKKVQAGSYKRVVLLPLMVVAGDHAHNDMAGDGEDSWKSIFEAAGYEVECVLSGLGEYPPVCDIYVQHTREAMADAGIKVIFR